MSSAAAHAYAQAVVATGNSHEIKAQVLLKAARKLQALVTTGEATRSEVTEALVYNEKIWSLLLAEALNDESPYPPELRKNMTDIGLFALSHTYTLQVSRIQLDEFKVLIEINRTIAAGLNGRV